MRRLFFSLFLMVSSPLLLQAGCCGYDGPPAGLKAGSDEWRTVPCDAYCGWDWFNFCDYRFNLELGGSWRIDQLKWSIAGPDGVPNILSELRWDELKMWLYELRGRWIFADWLYVRARADYGKIFQGEHHDDDYFGNNKTFPFSKSRSSAGRGEVMDFLGGAGIYLTFCQDRVMITPLGGYFYSEQHLRQYHGRQLLVLDPFGNPVYLHPPIKIKHLHSDYKTRWQGPWVGADWSFELYPDWILLGSVQYCRVTKFDAKGHWNLRHDFVKDFRQESRSGHGTIVSFGTAVRMVHWKLNFLGEFLNLHAGRGVDTTYFSFGAVHTPLNGVDWHSFKATILASYEF